MIGRMNKTKITKLKKASEGQNSDPQIGEWEKKRVETQTPQEGNPKSSPTPPQFSTRLNPTRLRFSQNRHSCYFTSTSGFLSFSTISFTVLLFEYWQFPCSFFFSFNINIYDWKLKPSQLLSCCIHFCLINYLGFISFSQPMWFKMKLEP